MGQQLSALSGAKQKGIDIKQQAAATDLLEKGVWYYNPSTGKNVWGNRAALQLYGLSAEDFCGNQQAAWLSTGGDAALQAWQLSNKQLLQALRCRAGQEASAQPAQLSGGGLTVLITTSSVTSSAACAGSVSGSSSSCAVHAAFLPLPVGVQQVSARLSACSMLHRGQQVPGYLVQVLGAELSCGRARISHGSMRRSLELLSAERNGSQLAALQLTLTQHLNLQPEVLPAARPLAVQQQQQQLSSHLEGTQQEQQQQQQQDPQLGCPTGAAAGVFCSTSNGTVRPQATPDAPGSAAAAVSPVQVGLSLQSSSPSSCCQAPTLCAGAATAVTTRSFEGGAACGPEVQAAAQRLRRSFQRRASLEVPTADPAAQHIVGAGSARPGSFDLFRQTSRTAASSVRRTHSSFARLPSRGIDKQQHLQQQLGSCLASGGSSMNPVLESSGSCSGSSSGCQRQGNSGAAQASSGLPPLHLRTNSHTTSPQLLHVGEKWAARQLRLTEMCDQHAMFQFLFDAEGQLLAANMRAMNNMREHLGEHSTYTLPQYLAMGQCDGGLSAEQIFAVISNAIFTNMEPCFRLPQLRYSKRRPGKCRWVLYEMWGMDDPVTGQPALLVTEQNITQVKAVEEQYSSHMRQLEVQLEEALQQQQQAEQATAAAEAAAAEAAAVVAAAAFTDDGSGRATSYLPAIDTSSAAEKTLQLLDKLLLGAPVALEDVEGLRRALLVSGSNMHAPLFLDEQMLHHTQALAYDSEVGASLLQMLGSSAWVAGGSGALLEDPTSCLPDVAEGDSACSTSDSNTQASTSGSSFAVAAGGLASSGSGSLSAFVGAGGAVPMSPGGMRAAGAVSPPLAVDTCSSKAAVSRCSTAAGSDSEDGEKQKLGQPSAVAKVSQRQRQQRKQQQHWPQLVSAYPKVTADTLPAAAATAANGLSGGYSDAAGLGVCGSGSRSARGSVTAGARGVMALTAAPTQELEALLARADDWYFDSFELTAVTDNRPLSVLAFFLLKRSNLVKRCGLDESRLARWLVRLEQGYPPNPYHNRTHAADVMRSMHVLLTRGGLGSAAAADDLATLAAYMAAVVHDYEHGGVNNDFLVRSCDALALLYNDHSPHENHHLAASWGVLVEHDFLHSMPRAKRELLRRLVIDMVLATDMKQHFAIHGLFQSKLHKLAALGMARSSSSATAVALPTASSLPGGNASDSRGIAGSPSRHHVQLGSSALHPLSEATTCTGAAGATSAAAAAAAPAASREAGGTAAARTPPALAGAGSGSFVTGRLRSSSSGVQRSGAGAAVSADGGSCCEEENAESRCLYLQVALKASDLGHLAAPREVHKQWVAALEEENFRQGDRERAVGLPVSPLMDRSKQGISRSQVGFFDIVALPFYTSLAQRFPGCRPMLEAVLENYAVWKAQEQQHRSS